MSPVAVALGTSALPMAWLSIVTMRALQLRTISRKSTPDATNHCSMCFLWSTIVHKGLGRQRDLKVAKVTH